MWKGYHVLHLANVVKGSQEDGRQAPNDFDTCREVLLALYRKRRGMLSASHGPGLNRRDLAEISAQIEECKARLRGVFARPEVRNNMPNIDWVEAGTAVSVLIRRNSRSVETQTVMIVDDEKAESRCRSLNLIGRSTPLARCLLGLRTGEETDYPLTEGVSIMGHVAVLGFVR